MPVDARKAKHLAHRMRQAARQYGLPRLDWVSPLQRARAVGHWLRQWGWKVQVDARLAEMDFGAWDGRTWADIAWAEVGAWEADLLHHAAGGDGETLHALVCRVQAWADEAVAAATPRLLVSHGGWINSLLQLSHLRHLLHSNATLAAADWPAAPLHSSLRRWPCGSQPAVAASR